MTVRQFTGLIDEMNKITGLESSGGEQGITGPAAVKYFDKLITKNRKRKA